MPSSKKQPGKVEKRPTILGPDGKPRKHSEDITKVILWLIAERQTSRLDLNSREFLDELWLQLHLLVHTALPKRKDLSADRWQIHTDHIKWITPDMHANALSKPIKKPRQLMPQNKLPRNYDDVGIERWREYAMDNLDANENEAVNVDEDVDEAGDDDERLAPSKTDSLPSTSNLTPSATSKRSAPPSTSAPSPKRTRREILPAVNNMTLGFLEVQVIGENVGAVEAYKKITVKHFIAFPSDYQAQIVGDPQDAMAKIQSANEEEIELGKKKHQTQLLLQKFERVKLAIAEGQNFDFFIPDVILETDKIQQPKNKTTVNMQTHSSIVEPPSTSNAVVAEESNEPVEMDQVAVNGKTHHDYAKLSLVRRDRSDFWEGIEAHNATVTCAIFSPHPEAIIKPEIDNEIAEKEKIDPLIEERKKGCGGNVLVSVDFTGCIKVFINKTKPKHSSLPYTALD